MGKNGKDKKTKPKSRKIRRSEVVMGEGGDWHVRAIGGNNEIILTSEPYETLSWARKIADDLGVPYTVVDKHGDPLVVDNPQA